MRKIERGREKGRELVRLRQMLPPRVFADFDSVQVKVLGVAKGHLLRRYYDPSITNRKHRLNGGNERRTQKHVFSGAFDGCPRFPLVPDPGKRLKHALSEREALVHVESVALGDTMANEHGTEPFVFAVLNHQTGFGLMWTD